MLSKSTWLHLRIPFSFFLLPVFLFALAHNPNSSAFNIALVFISIHLFLYPASNGYNSYFDKDEKSIGGLKHPPEVSLQLYFAALAFDFISILLGFLINWQFALMLFVYGLVSKAYSHPSIRLKRYPVLSWFIAGLFQGAFTYVMTVIGLTSGDLYLFMDFKILVPALLSSAILWGSYPMTQIYQHEEDKKRGDITLSIKLGVKGTFYFTGLVFGGASLGFFLYFREFHQEYFGFIFLLAMAPVVLYFSWWFLKALKDSNAINFDYTMKLNLISSLLLNLFFLYLVFDSSFP